MAMKRMLFTGLVVVLGAGIVWVGATRMIDSERKSARRSADKAVPIEVAQVRHGLIEDSRTFTGTLDAQAEFVVAPKVSGRIEQLDVDLADTVIRGQRVAKLDDAEYVQSVAQAEASYAVARANLVEAESLLSIAERELQRVAKLHQRGVASDSQRDSAKVEQLAKQARVEVTRAEVARAQAALESARIRLGYTNVTADWHGGDDKRVVAERFADEGQTVADNAPLLRIVETDPIIAVFNVTERDYALLKPGQGVTLSTDAHPGQRFSGSIARIAPVFRETTRQARVEVLIDNPEQRLKPGMFARATVVLDRIENAVLVPEQALVRREGGDGVFVVNEDGSSVAWRNVEVGYRQNGVVQITSEGLTSRVVTLGQQLLDDKSVVTITSRYAE